MVALYFRLSAYFLCIFDAEHILRLVGLWATRGRVVEGRRTWNSDPRTERMTMAKREITTLDHDTVSFHLH